MVKTEAPAHAKAAGNSYSLHLRQGAPLLDSTVSSTLSKNFVAFTITACCPNLFASF